MGSSSHWAPANMAKDILWERPSGSHLNPGDHRASLNNRTVEFLFKLQVIFRGIFFAPVKKKERTLGVDSDELMWSSGDRDSILQVHRALT